MDRLHDIIINLPEDLQCTVLNQTAGSYAVWVEDIVLYIDCITFEDEQSLEDDINFIQLCVRLGWVSEAVLIPVREEHLQFWGGQAVYYRRSHLETVGTIIRALGDLPYSFDEEYRGILESAGTPRTPPSSPNPSYNLPLPPYHWPYTTRFFPSWSPRQNYNPLDDPLQSRYVDPTTWGAGASDWDEAGWDIDYEEPTSAGSWGGPL